MKARILIITLIISLLSSSLVYGKENKINPPKLNCHAGIVIDQNSGRVLYGKNEKKILPMASTTKIITAIVAIENGNLNDKVTISKEASSVRGSTAKFKEGEVVSLEELIYGLMMKSGNDAAVAISEHIGNGDTQKFIDLMNKKVLEIGLYNTHFVTPHGLDADTHETTAEDLAKATAYALKNETFQKVSSCKEIASGESGEFTKSYNNINKFLFKLPDADGVKTGYTGNAGKCLVASIYNDKSRYIAVTLNSGDRWKDCENLVNYAKENYEYKKVDIDKDNLKPVTVIGNKKELISPKIENEIYVPILKDGSETIDTNFQLGYTISAPIKEGDSIGNLIISINGDLVSKYSILSNKSVDNN